MMVDQPRGPVLRIERSVTLPLTAGGKARGLQLIARAGLPMPPSWVVLPGAPAASLDALASELLRDGHALLAVRSSAPDEDADGQSFAGIHESLLGVRIEGLAEAVTRVASSALSPRACAYRAELGLPVSSGPCAVVVQPLVTAECAGVAFSAGQTQDVVVEAVQGLGETAVDGEADPEWIALQRADGVWRVGHRRPCVQRRLTRVERGGMMREELPEDRREPVVLLDDAGAARIAEGVAALQRLAARPLDVEWAWAGGTAWFLQARPQTRPLGDALPRDQIWTRANLREVLPDIPSAFTRSTIGPALDAAQGDYARSYGIQNDPLVPLATFVHGRPVFNERIFLVADLLGVSREALQAEFGGSGAPVDLVPSLDLRTTLRHPGVLIRAVAVALGAPRRAHRFLERLAAEGGALRLIDPPAATDRELLDAVEHVCSTWLRELALNAMRVAAAASNAQAAALRLLRGHRSPRAILAALLMEGEPSVSTQLMDDLVELAAAMRGWPDAPGFLRFIHPEHASADAWRRQLPPDLWGKVRRWLDRYGHRGPYESDMASPRYRDDLRLLAVMLAPLMSSLEDMASHSRTARQVIAGSAWQEVERVSGRSGLRRTRRALRRLKRILALRERVRSETGAAMMPLRSLVLELGRRLAGRRQLDAADDVWHLSLAEIRRATFRPDLRMMTAVDRERARLAAWRRVEVPNRFTSEDVESFGPDRSGPDEAPTVLRGNGISPGVVEAEVRVLWSPLEHVRFPSGCVLVAPATNPGWTPLFARAVGVISEIGGALSHAGTVAREYGVPCVSNVARATRVLRDGDVVRLDGSTGAVTVVSRGRDTELQRAPGGC